MGRRFGIGCCLVDGSFIFLCGTKTKNFPDQIEGTRNNDQTIRTILASNTETPYVGQCDCNYPGCIPRLVDDSR